MRCDRLTAVLLLLAVQRGCAAGSKGCRFPGAPAHSSVFFSDDSLGPETVATYSCERGFELLGPARRVCGRDGVWTPEGIPFCVLNVAAGKAPMQISSDLGGIPQKAIDGSTSSFFNVDTCTLTRAERVPWWYVNLLEPYMVQLVRLDFGRNLPATVLVRVGNNRPDLGTNPICNRFTGQLEEGKPLFLPCNPPMPGAFVSIHLEAANLSQLSICEAFVYTDQALPIERCPQFRDQPPGSTATYNGKCYIFYNRQPLTFKDSLAFCRSRGGTLVDESNPALQGFISWELWRRHRSDSNSQYWMGAVRDPQDRNNWKWLGGEDVTVSFWNLPGGNENCARYDGSKGWLWSDTNCNAKLNFICQHQPKACGKPEQPPNSTMVAKNFNVGAVIDYTCDEGHLLVGPASRTCLPTGFYNEFPPVCKRIQCGFPAEIPNGQYQLLNGTVGYMSRVIYSCDVGYELIGRAQLMCDIDERWNGPPPRCEAIECDDPPSIQNGKFTVSNNLTVVGTMVEYLCNSQNYKLIGSNKIICLPSGEYDDNPPVCKEERQTVAAVPVSPSKPTRPQTPPSKAHGLPVTPTRPSLPPARPGPQSPHQEHPSREKPSKRPPASTDSKTAESAHIPHTVAGSHPQDNEIPDSVNVRSDLSPDVNVAHSVDEERHEAGARLNLGAIIALGVFGGFVFLAAVITTIVILIRSGKKHKLPPARTMPSRWYTLLALPFPDQQVGRREFSRGAAYRNRTTAGYFSNPL
ncbi:CUB and sushi domain-containing protein 3 isoform X3 [Zootermopsis nevadensis]|uniref:CUB and sushi domain-containing protein 3 isoform X3 n=1 Tax=Zootermopsis nevadensis TaxID=136037 RepID=UPI000B8EE1A6|nr:CUB and sushi domain-containing protein 3 isoform X3 [Zootermopsis nevadensis]